MKHNYLLLLAILLFTTPALAQNGIIGAGFTNGWNTQDITCFGDGLDGTRIITLTPQQTDGSGNAFFRMVRCWSGDNTQYGPFNCTDTNWTNGEESSYDNMPVCNNNGAFFINVPNLTDNYVFKTPNGASGDDFVYYRVQGPIRNMVSASQSPASQNSAVSSVDPVTCSATFDGALPTGQKAYLYYIAIAPNLDLTTEVLPMTDSGNGLTYTAQIPPFADGTFVSYLYLTSGDQVTPAATPEDVAYRSITFDDNGGNFYAYTTSVALPVTFAAWTGARANQHVNLNWVTATEQNASHFVLECSENDGRTWNERAQVAAQNAATGATYRYQDQDAPVGRLQYRLRQVDFDGQFMYSSILNISGRKEVVGTVDVFPQPASAAGMNIRLSEHFAGGLLELYDPAGRLVQTRSINQSTTERLETAGLPAGVYLLRVVASTGEVLVKKAVVR